MNFFKGLFKRDERPQWETYTLNVASANTVFAAMFYTLLGEGHFSVSAQILFASGIPNRTGKALDVSQSLSSYRDQAILEALQDFVAHIPPPLLDESQMMAALQKMQVKWKRLDCLVPGAPKRLLDLMEGNPSFLYFKWPEQLIVKDQANQGWEFVSKEPIVQDGLSVGTAYTFRRPFTRKSAKTQSTCTDPVSFRASSALSLFDDDDILPSGRRRSEYHDYGMTDEDLEFWGLDQPGAPPPEVAGWVVGDMMDDMDW